MEREVEVPDDLAAALEAVSGAREAFEGFPRSHRREYVEWVEEAKRAATRERRIAKTVDGVLESGPQR